MSSKPEAWMPLYVGDYLASTSRLTTEQHGAYLLLIMDYWREGPPPDDDAILAQITRMTPDAWSIARAVLSKYFSIEDGCWRQSRIDKELATAKERHDKAKARATRAAEARWGNSSPDNNATSKAQAVLDQCQSQSQAQASKNKPPKSPKGDAPGFDEFWAQYPKKRAKPAALKAWNKIRPDDQLQQKILSAIRVQSASADWMKESGQYIPLPATWLNGCRWEDEIDVSTASAQSDPVASEKADLRYEMQELHSEIKSLQQLGIDVPEEKTRRMSLIKQRLREIS